MIRLDSIILILALSLHPTQLMKLDSRITKSEYAKEGQFPFMASLEFVTGWFESNSWCSGSIISEHWILTSAKCTVGSSSVKAYLGTLFNDDSTIIYKINSVNFYLHKKFNPATFAHDIALINTPKIIFTVFVQKIQLPILSYRYTNYTYESGTIMGWGVSRDDMNFIMSKYLKFAKAYIWDDRICQSFGKNIFTKGNLCVASNSSICMGDAGGPFVIFDHESKQPMQIGIASYGFSPCELGVPNVYTKITHYLPWMWHVTKIPSLFGL